MAYGGEMKFYRKFAVRMMFSKKAIDDSFLTKYTLPIVVIVKRENR